MDYVIIDVFGHHELENINGIKAIDNGLYTTTYKIDTTKVIVDESYIHHENTCDGCNNGQCDRCANNNGFTELVVKISPLTSKRCIVLTAQCMDQLGSVMNDLS